MLCGAHMVSGGSKLIADMLGAEMASHVACGTVAEMLPEYVVAVADAAAARNHARLAGGQLSGASQLSLRINPSAHVCAVGAAHVAASVDRAAPASAVDPDAAAVTAAASVAVR